MTLAGLLRTAESDLTLSVSSCVETVWSLDGGDAELIVTEGPSGDEPLTLDSTGVMLQDSDARSDVEDKLCDRSGSGVLTQRSVGVTLASPPGVECCDMSLRSGGRSGDNVEVWERTSGVEIVFPEDLPGVAEIVSKIVGGLLSVDLTSVVCEEDDSTMDGL
jgi:hypothetical protein